MKRHLDFIHLSAVVLWTTLVAPPALRAQSETAVLVKDIFPGPGSPGISEMVNVNGTLFFGAASEVQKGLQLWKTDLAGGGAVAVVPDAGFTPIDLVDVNGTLFFSASGESGRQLWKSDGTAGGTAQVNATDPAQQLLPRGMFNANGTVYFSGFADDRGRELWKSDGTAGGTVMVKDITPGRDSTVFFLTNSLPKSAHVGDTVFFVADDGIHGRELWKSDGTAAGTMLVKDIDPNGSALLFGSRFEGPSFVAFGDAVYFSASDGMNGRELWRSDGTEDGTFMVANLLPGGSSFPQNLTVAGGALYFTANIPTFGRELWRTDGTDPGTGMVADINPGGRSSSPWDLTEVGGTVFFSAEDSFRGYQLWSTDGTQEGTLPVKNFAPSEDGANPGWLVASGGFLYFAADSPGKGNELWKSDGTASGTRMVADINPGEETSVPADLTDANGTLYLLAERPESGRELWTVALGPEPPPPPLIDGAADVENAGAGGDPVNTFTGELYNQFAPDLAPGGPMPLFFSRYYASGLQSLGITGSLGTNWRHRFEWTLESDGAAAEVIQHRGRSIEFESAGGAWRLSGRADIPYQLSEDGGEFTLADPRSQNVYTFNEAGQLTSIGDGRGNVHTLAYNGSGQLTEVADGRGRVLTFAYTGDHLASVSDGTRAVTFGYDGDHLTSVTDASGNVATYSYGAGGLMTSSKHPEGNSPFTQTYDVAGRVVSQTDGSGNTFTFEYEPPETTLTDPLGNTTVHVHTATGELSDRRDEMGESIALGSDETGRRAAITDRMGGVTATTYHAPSGKVGSVTRADGSVTSYEYTERMAAGATFHDLTGITHADGTTESFAYDAAGNLISRTDRDGHESTFTYNANGQPLTFTNAAGGVSAMAYNDDGTLASATDPAGGVTTYAYDELKRLATITRPDGSTVDFTLDESDRLLASTDEGGGVLTMTYDANGRLSTIADPLGGTATLGYDENDRLVSLEDALGATGARSYDELGRLRAVTDRSDGVTTLGYDALGRLTSISDPLGNVSTATYNAEAIITSRTDPMGNTTSFESDAMGRITSVTGPLGGVMESTYDELGRVATVTDALGQVTTLERDARGLLTGVRLPGGASTTCERDGLGNVTALTDLNGSVWERTYDDPGRQTSSTDPLGNVRTTTYDNRGRASIVTLPGDLGALTLRHDAVGNLVELESSGGTKLSYTYDAANRLTEATGMELSYDANGRVASTNGIAIGREASGRLETMTLAAGKTVTYRYDAAGQLTEVEDWAGGKIAFTHDAAGRRTVSERSSGVDTAMTYDDEGRIIGLETGALATITLTRDARGQITAATRDVPAPPSASGLLSRTLTYDAAAQVSSFNYDELGRLTSDGERTFSWDLGSRLTSVASGGETVSYTYDATGKRLSRTAAGTTREFVWNYALARPSISVEREGGADLRYYVHTPDGSLLYSIDAAAGSRRFYHFDERGNTLFLTDDAGAAVGSYAYSPYGEVTASTGELDNPFTWQGEAGVMAEGDGLYYVRARYYDSASARFLSRDPVTTLTPKRVNPYQYADGNPLRFIDPTGEEPDDEEGAMTMEEFWRITDGLLAGTEANVKFELVNPDALADELGALPLRRSRREEDILEVTREIDDLRKRIEKIDKKLEPDVFGGFEVVSRIYSGPSIFESGIGIFFEDPAENRPAWWRPTEDRRERSRLMRTLDSLQEELETIKRSTLYDLDDIVVLD